MLTSFLNGARSRAIATGRPVGVVFEHETQTSQARPSDPVTTSALIPDFVTRLAYTEVPPPWSGDTVNSTVALTSADVVGPNALDARAKSCVVIPSPGFDQGDLSWMGLLKQGDRVRFNFEGKWYRIYSGDPWVDANGNGTADPDEYLDWDYDGRFTPPQTDKDGNLKNVAINPLMPPDYSMPPKPRPFLWLASDEPFDPANNSMPSQVRFAPPPATPTFHYPYVLLSNNYRDPSGTEIGKHPKFQFERQPTRSATDILQLPEGAGVDLYWSGMQNDTAFFGDAGTGEGLPPARLGQMRPMILFGPSGRVEYVYNGAAGFRPTGTIFLLVGRPDARMSILNDADSPIPVVPLRNAGIRVTPPPQFGSNLVDSRSLWVAVSPQNGLVTTTENYVGDVGPDGSGVLTTGGVVAQRRAYAKSGRNISGK